MNQRGAEKSMRERMLAGEPYIALDPELDGMQARAQRLLHTFNMSTPDDADQRRWLLQELFGAIGEGSEVKPPFYCDYGSHIFAGERVFINYDCVVLDCNVVRLGDRVLLGPKVQIYTATHPLAAAERMEGRGQHDDWCRKRGDAGCTAGGFRSRQPVWGDPQS